MNYMNQNRIAAGQQSGSVDYSHTKINWLPIPDGKYKGISVPTVFFFDPKYFAKLMTYTTTLSPLWFGSALSEQIRKIDFRSRYILPPFPYKQFLIAYTSVPDSKADEYRFKCIRPLELAYVSETTASKYDCCEADRVLNVSGLSKKLKTKTEWKRLRMDLHGLFCTGNFEYPIQTECERFFDDLANFDI